MFAIYIMVMATILNIITQISMLPGNHKTTCICTTFAYILHMHAYGEQMVAQNN